jgi:hypothetical protein
MPCISQNGKRGCRCRRPGSRTAAGSSEGEARLLKTLPLALLRLVTVCTLDLLASTTRSVARAKSSATTNAVV